MSTPKKARQHRRKPPTGDRTRNGNLYRVTASWDARPDRPAVRTTPDRRKARRQAEDYATAGAYVIVEQARGFQWRTLYEIDGPALLATAEDAARAKTDRQAAAERDARLDAEIAAQAITNERAIAEHDALARLMTRPPVARDATGRVTARHTTGGHR